MSKNYNTDKHLNKTQDETSIIDQFKEQTKLLAHLKPFNTVIVDASNVHEVKALYNSLRQNY